MEELKSKQKQQNLRPEEQIRCDSCGRYGAVELSGRHLCVDCYEARGSCCPEFGGDDLWNPEEAPPRTPGQKQAGD